MNKKEEEIYLRIYEANKERMYWLLRKKCTWLKEDEIPDIMQEVWEALSVNFQKVSDDSKGQINLGNMALNQSRKAKEKRMLSICYIRYFCV